eukprot:5439256-Amphidinium_carterae.1
MSRIRPKPGCPENDSPRPADSGGLPCCCKLRGDESQAELAMFLAVERVCVKSGGADESNATVCNVGWQVSKNYPLSERLKE